MTEGQKPRVAVIGGGIAGLTCAVKLLRAGCDVTIYEAKDRLGGNIASEYKTRDASGASVKVLPGEVPQDVYPHIFPDWYANFWRLLEDELQITRQSHFEARWGVKVLDKPAPGQTDRHYKVLEYAPTLTAVMNTLKSGLLSIPDFVLFVFLNLDLAAMPPDPEQHAMLNMLDVNGFFYSRGYSTDLVAELQNYIITVIWSLPSSMTAASTYQAFIKHQLSASSPSAPYAWMLKGSLHEEVILPLGARLAQLGGKIRTGAKAASVEVVGGAPRITFGPAGEVETAEYVVLAVPGMELSDLVRRGEPGARLMDKVPALSQIKRTWGEAIPVVNIYFTKRLTDIPAEIVGLRQSHCDLTFLDISQLWTALKPGAAEPDTAQRDVTVLVLAASNAYAIPASDPEEQAILMIRRLAEYLPGQFDPGNHWGESPDIDWTRTVVRSNEGHLLFVDDVGSKAWRPVTSYEALPNVFFAGDVCQTDVSMATVEAAVQSGLMAAQALYDMDQSGQNAPRRLTGGPITLAPHEVFSDATLLAAKLALLPVAYGASAWSALLGRPEEHAAAIAGKEMAYPFSTYALLLPFNYAIDWWRTAYWLVRSLRLAAGGAYPVEGVDPCDTPVGLGVGGLWTPRRRREAPSPAPQFPGRGQPTAPAAAPTLMGIANRLLKTAVGTARFVASGKL
jgi:hypothetical protein